jgi:hypothetical protein
VDVESVTCISSTAFFFLSRLILLDTNQPLFLF